MEEIDSSELIKRVEKSLSNRSNNKNSMGCSENNYDIYYMIGRTFTVRELGAFNIREIKMLIKLANYASEAFY